MAKKVYKSLMSKNGRWGVAYQVFHKGCKNLNVKSYKNGIRFWKDSFNTGTLALVINCTRLMIYFPCGKNTKETC